MNQRVWISLLEVEPSAKSQYKKFGNAFVNAIAGAKSKEEAISSIESALNKIGWELISVEDLDLYDKRIKNYKVSLELQKLATIVKKTGDVQFGTFHTWRKNEKKRDRKKQSM